VSPAAGPASLSTWRPRCDSPALPVKAARGSNRTPLRLRASAVDEFEKAGTFEDVTQLGAGQDDIDRQLAPLSTGNTVDDELAKMKLELPAGEKSGEPAPGPQLDKPS
jgi:hypothetical protein